MLETQEKNRISAVNIVFLISTLITVAVAFLPLNFLVERPALQIIFSQVILALPSVVYMIKYRLPYAEMVGLKKLKFADMALCILFGILIQPLLTLLNAVSMVFASNTMSNFMLSLSKEIPFPAALLLMAVLPAFLEESVYRGVFYREYSRVNPWRAALLSGLLFGLMHGNINQFCYAAVMGIIFALLIEATGSILSTMLVHFWINAGSVVTIYLLPKVYQFMQNFYNMYVEYNNTEMVEMIEATFGSMTLTPEEWMETTMSASEAVSLSLTDVLLLYGPQALVMGILAFLVYRKLARRSGNWERICGFFRRKRSQKMVTVPLVIAMIVSIAFMVFYEIVVHMQM